VKLLPGSSANQEVGFIILPPMGSPVPNLFKDVEVEDSHYVELLSSMQRFRGSMYLSDGAILPEQLSGDGRHIAPSDEESWHVLTLNQMGNICACLKFHEERPSTRYNDLDVWQSALAQCVEWGETLRKAVELERFNAQALQLRFGEVGGWAIAPDRRNSRVSLDIILAAFGLLNLLGGGVGLATATVRHGSASILRRLGLSPMSAEGQELPVYYDPNYRCEMELLSFDSRTPSAKYTNWVALLSRQIACAPVICAKRHVGYPVNTPNLGTLKRWLPMAGIDSPSAPPQSRA
jgi:hypothetical protein